MFSALIYYVSIDTGDRLGMHAAWGANLMMSVMFLSMLERRKDLRGQSFCVALTKCLGTASVAVGQLQYPIENFPRPLHAILAIAIFAADLTYVVLLYRRMRALDMQPLNPWRDVVAQRRATLRACDSMGTAIAT
jgi:hypothetical protein